MDIGLELLVNPHKIKKKKNLIEKKEKKIFNKQKK